MSSAQFARSCMSLVVLAGPWMALATAQGRTDYMNVESPQVSPIALTTVDGHRVLLACNTPDNSVEIWSAGDTPVFLWRIPVGLEPVSVHAHDELFWTANFLGDSVTAAELVLVASNPLDVRAKVLATRNLGDEANGEVLDEPMDIAYHHDTGSLFVTLHTQSAVAWLDATTLAPRSAGVYRLEHGTTTPKHGLKEPRAVRVHGDRVYVTAFKGGLMEEAPAGVDFRHDLDVLSSLIPTSPSGNLDFNVAIAGLGSTNFNARFDDLGRLWVVGGEAKNVLHETKSALRDAATGFVQSTLYRVTNPGSTPDARRRDTNREKKLPLSSPISTKDRALAMPTDLAVYQTSTEFKVFVCAFSSDRIGVFEDTLSPTGSSSLPGFVKRVMAPPVVPVGGNARWGPRGMVLGLNQTGVQRLFVLNRLDNSLSVYDPDAEVHVASVPLHHDPTPPHIRAGRPFLYSAEISGSGFVSCASCHTDGRTDALSWKLGDPLAPPAEPAPTHAFIFGLGDTGAFASDATFFVKMFLSVNPFGLLPVPTFDWEGGVDDKREMVTQSLQGLSNFEVHFEPAADPEQADLVRRMFHNGPFHWRGDKETLRNFNEAFVTLLGGIDPNPNPIQGDVRGLTPPQMDDFETFIHSIVYPPNPKQPRSRAFSESTTGGQEGLRLFHVRDFTNPVAGRSCVHCHSLPEGSNNRLTDFQANAMFDGFVGASNRQPIETAALRGLFQKEPLLETDGNDLNTSTATVVGRYGLSHNGVLTPSFDKFGTVHTSINVFIDGFFDSQNSVPNRAISQFVHEMDWGVAPMVGRVVHYSEPSGGGFPEDETLNQIAAMGLQALKANAGVVVWVTRPSQNCEVRGFYLAPEFSNSMLPYPYFEEPGSFFGTIDDIEVLLAPGDSLVAVSVPLGSERRIASPSGMPEAPAQGAPGPATLMPMVPSTAYLAVPDFRENWVPVYAPTAIKDTLTDAECFDFVELEPAPGVLVGDVFTKVLRLFQYGLLERPLPVTALSPTYGVAMLRHEAPRRFQIGEPSDGNTFVPGAKLLLSVPMSTTPAGATPRSLLDSGHEADIHFVTLELPIFPRNVILTPHRVWETAVELDPFWAYVLMLGGPNAPGVQDTIDYVTCSEYTICGVGGTDPNALPNPPAILEPTESDLPISNWQANAPFDPDGWNWFKVQIRNPDGQLSPASFQQLTMAE